MLNQIQIYFSLPKISGVELKLYYVYNFLGIKPEQVLVSGVLKPGKYIVGMEFIREKAGQYKESLGQAKLYVNEKMVAEGPIRVPRWVNLPWVVMDFVLVLITKIR